MTVAPPLEGCWAFSQWLERLLYGPQTFSPPLLPTCEVISSLIRQFSAWADLVPWGTFGDVWRCFSLSSLGEGFATGTW